MLCGGGGACGKLVIVDLHSVWIILGFDGRKVCGGGKGGMEPPSHLFFGVAHGRVFKWREDHYTCGEGGWAGSSCSMSG